MFTEIVTPSFGDIDGLRHVNNCVLARWFEQARNPLFRFFTPDLDLDYSNWRLIMARTEYDFLGETFYDCDVELRTWIEKVGNSSFIVLHEAWQDERLCCRGRAVTVHYDFENKKAIPIPDDIRAKLEEHLVGKD